MVIIVVIITVDNVVVFFLGFLRQSALSYNDSQNFVLPLRKVVNSGEMIAVNSVANS